jgi:site-specific DNA-methyltransferase (adenine-specific)
MARLALLPKPEPVDARAAEPCWLTSLRQGEAELWARVRAHGDQRREHLSEHATYILGDTINWLSDLPPNCIHAIVTDPPYGLIEYDRDPQYFGLARTAFPQLAAFAVPDRDER